MTSNGYTARVARVIAASTGADVFEVETAEPYPAGYSKTTDVVQDEFDRKIYRVLKKPLPDLSAYDTVFIGHPIWWGRIPAVFIQGTVRGRSLRQNRRALRNARRQRLRKFRPGTA